MCDGVNVFVGKENTFNNGALLFVQQCALQEPRDESVDLDSILITVTPLIFSEPLSIIKVKIQISKT